MIGQKVLVRQTKSIMRGGNIISTEVIYERPKETPKVTPPPAIKKPESPPVSPTSKDRPEFLEPLSPTPRTEAYRNAFLEDLKKRQEEYLIWESQQPGTWYREIEMLERRREKYNKKAAWSASDMAEVDRIDKKIKECEKILETLEEEDWYSGEESE
jgi:hypothetical protein